MKINIRQPLETEIDTLLSFEKGIIDTERPFDNSLAPDPIHYYDLLELIKSNTAQVMVACMDNEIIGSGYAKIIEAKPYHKFTSYAYLGFMYVKPDYRGNRVNQLIIDELIIWVKSKNITEVRLEVYLNNESAVKAYTKVGFKPNLVEMRMEI
jgi:GNAT superfamily N-acetyltransferase